MTDTMAAASSVSTLVRLAREVTVRRAGDDIEVLHRWGAQRIRNLGVETAAELVALTERPGPVSAGSRLAAVLAALPFLMVTVLLDDEGGELAMAEPMGRQARALMHKSPETSLSRFAYLRHHEGRCVLESALSLYRITLAPAAAVFVAALAAGPRSGAAGDLANLSTAEVDALTSLLGRCGFLSSGDAEAPLWAFHDLLFHTRSRAGRHDYQTGAHFAHLDVPHPPALAEPDGEGPAVVLAVPDWEAVVAADPPLTSVLENRRSIREYAPEPVTLQQLGELLYRGARIRRVTPFMPGTPTAHTGLDKPYPSGGAMGELDIYLAVAECRGLEPGVYRYDAAGHRLFPRNGDQAAYQRLLHGAWQASAFSVKPQVLLNVIARCGRLAWKYDQIAYAVTLKHVGVLYQTLYLVASAMGLAPCALGNGDSDCAAAAFGVDWLQESPVGEFLIGSRQEVPEAASGFVDVVQASR